MRFIIRLIIIALGVYAMPYLVPGIAVSSFYIALIVAILWALISCTLKPILFLLTLPITLLTLGLFSFILNAFLFWFLASFVSGFVVSGFIPALLGSLLLSVVVWVSHLVTARES